MQINNREIGIGELIVIGLVLIAIIAMLTGNDGVLLAKIVDWLTGIGIGSMATALERKSGKPKET